MRKKQTGNKIKSMCKANGLTIKKMCAQAGWDYPNICAKAKLEHVPTISKVAQHFGYSVLVVIVNGNEVIC